MGQTSHVASCFSAVDIATVLYSNLQKNDFVVWSAGWKAALIYVMLAKQGKLPVEDLDRFAKEENGKIEYLGLAETTTPGVWCNGGSVSHGLPIAVGMAYAKKLKGEVGNIHCIVSDGEMNEGSFWEATLFAGHHKLDNLIVWVDSNQFQALGKTTDVLDIDKVAMFKASKWYAKEIDGHDYEVLDRANHVAKNHGFTPMAFVCSTVKGKGVSFFENRLTFHYKHVDANDFIRATEELKNA